MSWFVTCLTLCLVTILVIKVVQSRDHHRAHKKQKHVKEYDADRVTRAHLLWDLLLTRNEHKRNSIPRPVHIRKSMEVHKVPLKLGLCTDQHPLCSSYALNGFCDWSGLFQNLNNIRNTCAFSCGYCKKNIPDGEVDFVGASWDSP